MFRLVPQRFLALLRWFIIVYTLTYVVLFFVQKVTTIGAVTTPPGFFFMSICLVYVIFFFGIAKKYLGSSTAFSAAIFLLSTGLASSIFATGGYLSPHELAWSFMIFLSCMLGLAVPSLLMVISATGFALTEVGVITSSTEAALPVLIRHAVALLVGYILFRRYYIRDDPEVEVLKKQLKGDRLQSDVLLSALNDGVVIIDSTEKIRFVNQRAVELLGVNGKAMQGKLFTHVFQSDDHYPKFYLEAGVLRVAIKQMFESHLPLRYEQVLLKTERDEDLSLSLSFTPVKNNDDEFSSAIVLLHDISELHHIQKIKDEFIAISSHELHTPMTVIKGYAELLLSTGDVSESQAHYLERIKDTADDLLHLSGNLLDMSRLSTGSAQLNPQEAQLHELVETITGHYRARCKAGSIELIVSIPDEANAYIDVEKFQKVLDNLIDNAYRHSQENDKIEVIVTDSSEVAFSITVIDDGEGIETDLRTRLFEQFSEENYLNHSRGTGLGLSLSKQFVELWGGTIEFIPNKDKGSLFRFTVPKYKKEI